MIAVDTSALLAVALDEPEAGACIDALELADRILISAATVAEALIVAARRNVRAEVEAMIDGLGFEIVSVAAKDARGVSAAYDRWGKGQSPASLNFGDCFAYELAKVYGCPLLYVGQDFAKTDIAAVR